MCIYSHSSICVNIGIPYGIIPYFAQDVSFTLDQLTTLNTKDPKGILTGKLNLAPLLPIPGIISGPIGSQRAHEIVNAYTLAFFDKYLKGKPEVLLAGPSAAYPEVIFAKCGP